MSTAVPLRLVNIEQNGQQYVTVEVEAGGKVLDLKKMGKDELVCEMKDVLLRFADIVPLYAE